MAESLRDSMTDSTAVTSAACGSCISRRAFVADATALAAVAALFAACGEPGIVGPVGQVQVKVGDFPGLATAGQLVLIDGQRAAKRTGSASFTAWSRLCTHEGTPVNVSGNGFICPNHFSQFNADGNVTVGPATAPLGQLATSYNSTTDILTIG